MSKSAELDTLTPRLWWLEVLQRQGFPTLLVIIMLFAGYRCCLWAVPILQNIATTHMEFVKSTDANNVSIKESIKTIEASTVAIEDSTKKLSEATEELTPRINDIHRAIIEKKLSPESPSP